MENSKLEPLQSLKICFIAGTLGVGGAERQLYLILSTLKRMGSQVSLICLNTGEYWEQPIKETGVSYYSLGGKGSKLQRLIKIISLLRKIKPDIVQSQHFYTNIYAAVSGRFLNIFSIGASRSDLKVEVRGNGIFGIPSLKWPRFFLLNSMRSFDQALAWGRSRSSTFYLPNALDTGKFNYVAASMRVNKGQFVFLAIGRLDDNKRFEKFIELISRLKKVYGNKVKGILIGSGILEDYLKACSRNFGLDKNDMEFISHTSEPETYLKSANLFILTSDFEGNPNVVLEAMACGLPVVSTKVGNLPFFIKDGDNGFFFDGTVDQLLKIVMGLMDDMELLNKVSINAVKKIEDCFSVEALEKNLAFIYNAIMN